MTIWGYWDTSGFLARNAPFCVYLCVCVFIFIVSVISPYTVGLRALFNPSDCTGTVPTDK